jgi:hypothetical protein
MSKAAAILIPAALFAAAIWTITLSIDRMVVKEGNNRFHAMLLNCRYMGPMEKMEQVLIFDCQNKIELHKEINWTLTN